MQLSQVLLLICAFATAHAANAEPAPVVSLNVEGQVINMPLPDGFCLLDESDLAQAKAMRIDESVVPEFRFFVHAGRCDDLDYISHPGHADVTAYRSLQIFTLRSHDHGVVLFPKGETRKQFVELSLASKQPLLLMPYLRRVLELAKEHGATFDPNSFTAGLTEASDDAYFSASYLEIASKADTLPRLTMKMATVTGTTLVGRIALSIKFGYVTERDVTPEDFEALLASAKDSVAQIIVANP